MSTPNRKCCLPCRDVLHTRSKTSEEELLDALAYDMDVAWYGDGMKPLWTKQFYNPYHKVYDVCIHYHDANTYPDPALTYKYRDFTVVCTTEETDE